MTRTYLLFALLFTLFFTGCNDTTTTTLYKPKVTGKKVDKTNEK